MDKSKISQYFTGGGSLSLTEEERIKIETGIELACLLDKCLSGDCSGCGREHYASCGEIIDLLKLQQNK